MKRGLTPKGFTIVEVMVFLGVSGALLITALFFINNTQGKTQFNQAANDAFEQITSVVNNVANGYYAGNDNVSCTISGGVPSASTGGAKDRGTNKGCIFLGRVVEFKSAGFFTVRDVVGAQKGGSGQEVTNIGEAKPQLIAGTDQEIRYKNGLRFRPGVGLKRDGTVITAVGFFSTLGQASATHTDQLETGAQQSDFIGINESTLTLNTLTQSYYTLNKNNTNGITLCLDDGERRAEILIGGEGRLATTSMRAGIGICT